MSFLRFAWDRVRAVWASQSGSPGVEFAFVAPPLMMILIGIVEVALVLAANILMEGAVRQAARFGLTGYVPAGTTRAAYIQQIIANDTAGLINVANMTVSTMIYPSFANVHQPEPFVDANGNSVKDAAESYTDVNGNGQWDADMGKAGLGGPGDIVLYTFKYTWPVITPLLKPILGGNDNVLHLQADVVVRNEPF